MKSAGRVLLIPKGDWNSATTYTYLDMVHYNGNTYICKAENTNITPSNTTYWMLSTSGEGSTTYIEEGEVLSLVNTSEGNGLVHKVYGMSSQDGTPTPSNPVDIDDSVANFTSVGKNLIPYPYYTSAGTLQDVNITIDSDYSMNLNGTASGRGFFMYRSRLEGDAIIKKPGNYTAIIEIKGGTYTLSSSDKFVGRLYATTASSPYKEIFRLDLSSLNVGVYTISFSVTQEDLDTYPVQGFWYELQSGNVYNNLEINATIQLAEVTDTTYEPYKSTTKSTNITLRAIEVTSADEYNLVRDGKYYVADTIEGDRIIRRIHTQALDFSILDYTSNANQHYVWKELSSVMPNSIIIPASNSKKAFLTCNYFETLTRDQIYSGTQGIGLSSGNSIFVNIDGYTSKQEYVNWATGKTVTVNVILATPTTETLTSEQIEALNSIKIYDVSTTISSPEPMATLNLEYAKDRTSALALSGYTLSNLLGIKKVSWDSQAILGAKNMLPYPYYETTKTTNGVTFTDNGDGTITANGTNSSSSSSAYITILSRLQGINAPLEIGQTYVLNGCPSGGSSTTYRIWMGVYKNGSWVINEADTGNGVEFTIPEGAEGITMNLEIRASASATNLVFKPMIRPASVKDDTYVPYAMTNKDITNIVKCNETTAGTYVLKAVVDSNGNVTYDWVVEE